MVPVHSEQCGPAILARIRACPFTVEGSTTHSFGEFAAALPGRCSWPCHLVLPEMAGDGEPALLDPLTHCCSQPTGSDPGRVEP